MIAKSSIAGVIIGGTRVIYDSRKKEASISVINPDKVTPYLIQSWVEKESTHESQAPFIITPPLFRLNAGQENTLRIIFTGGRLSSDRESQYWINIKSIPSTSELEKNQLLISVKTRIKLIYRPEGIKGDPMEAYQKLIFKCRGETIEVYNPTPFYIAFYSVKLNGKEVNNAGTLGPYDKKPFPLHERGVNSVSWQAINDFGGITTPENAKCNSV